MEELPVPPPTPVQLNIWQTARSAGVPLPGAELLTGLWLIQSEGERTPWSPDSSSWMRHVREYVWHRCHVLWVWVTDGDYIIPPGCRSWCIDCDTVTCRPRSVTQSSDSRCEGVGGVEPIDQNVKYFRKTVIQSWKADRCNNSSWSCAGAAGNNGTFNTISSVTRLRAARPCVSESATVRVVLVSSAAAVLVLAQLCVCSVVCDCVEVIQWYRCASATPPGNSIENFSSIDCLCNSLSACLSLCDFHGCMCLCMCTLCVVLFE